MDAPMTFRRLRASQSRYKIYQNVYDVMTLYHKYPCHPIATLYLKIYILVGTLIILHARCAARGKVIALSLYIICCLQNNL